MNEVSSFILIFDFINKLIEFNIKSSEDAGMVPEASFKLSLIKQVSLIAIIFVCLLSLGTHCQAKTNYHSFSSFRLSLS